MSDLIKGAVIMALIFGAAFLGWVGGYQMGENELKPINITYQIKNITYENCTQPTIQGLYTGNNSGIWMNGDWVHINIQNLNYTNAQHACLHEVGHEIFARECADNETKCLETWN